MKAATLGDVYYNPETDISIHAAREGGDVTASGITGVTTISIHAAREGGDPVMIALYNDVFEFQSTPPVKAATSLTLNFENLMDISIHAAREGGDGFRQQHCKCLCDFNPRRP